MPYIFFYSSVAVIWIIFLICRVFRKPALPGIIIGFTTVGYSLISDILFGDQLKLFYYIAPNESTLYMVLSAILIYPVLNILYTMYLPCDTRKALLYTGGWIVALLVFEYGSIAAKTIVFTGWRPFPWSIVTYIAAYLWIYYLYKLLVNRFSVSS